MIFIGPPNLYVRISSKFIQRATGKKGFRFDENGKYDTDNEWLIKLLKQHFPVDETHKEEPDKEINEENNAADDKPEKTYQCKHCDYATTNKGELLAHYRVHKKEG